MCLYPSIIENPKYAKSNENSKKIRDRRLRWIQIPCGLCEECRHAKANEWRVRLMEEIKSNPKNIIFATLTFSEESLKKLEYDEEEPNKAPQKAISLFRKRWWKKYKKPLKHWLITERGHDNTKRIHLHGIIWTELTEEQKEAMIAKMQAAQQQRQQTQGEEPTEGMPDNEEQDEMEEQPETEEQPDSQQQPEMVA